MPPEEPKSPATSLSNGSLNGAAHIHPAGGSSEEEGEGEGEGEEGEGDGSFEFEGDDAAAGIPLELPPPAVNELTAACVRFVATRYGVHLDFTPDTLSLVDQYVRDAREEVLLNDHALQLVQASIGAYLGEVLRRTFHGTWFTEGDHQGWRLDMTTVYLTFNPIGMAREALLLTPADGWHAHLHVDEEDRADLDARLAQLGSVEEDEYYAPTTRHDVVEIAVDMLRARARERGLGDVTFGPEDYKNR